MLQINKISKYKTWIVVLGLIVGLALVCHPVASYFFDSSICQIEQQSQDDSTDQEKPEAKISSFNAVTPAQQVVSSIADYFILEEIELDEDRDIENHSTFVEKLPEKLIRVLFNFIISPNAP